MMQIACSNRGRSAMNSSTSKLSPQLLLEVRAGHDGLAVVLRQEVGTAAVRGVEELAALVRGGFGVVVDERVGEVDVPHADLLLRVLAEVPAVVEEPACLGGDEDQALLA